VIDSHCHFDFSVFDADRKGHWQRSQQLGITHLVMPSIGASNWDKVRQLSHQNSGCFRYALGLHPYFMAEHQQTDLIDLAQRLSEKDPLCVAVGECGLDWAIDDPQKANQEDLLVAQQTLAIKYQLPMILHCRNAFPDLFRLFKQRFPEAGAIYHGFTGSYQQAKQWVDLGGMIGVGGSITYERANKTRQAIAKLPLSCLLLETDAPDMPLSGYQGQINTPQRLSIVAEELAKLQKKSRFEIQTKTTENTHNVFKF
jgi:TatD DNase family protein